MGVKVDNGRATGDTWPNAVGWRVDNGSLIIVGKPTAEQEAEGVMPMLAQYSAGFWDVVGMTDDARSPDLTA